MLQTGEFDYPIMENDKPVLGFSADYSEDVRKSFCTRYPPTNSSERCTLPLPQQNAKTLAQSTHEERLTTQRFNMFMSDMRAEAIGALASEAKNVSGGSLLVISFYVKW